MNDRIEHEARWLDATQKPGIPTRLINGTADPISGRHLADHYAKVIPNPDIVLLEGIGHYPQVEAPAKVLQAFMAFNLELKHATLT
jgi:pimeloyl-ACP methyl ester carboxylesterase